MSIWIITALSVLICAILLGIGTVAKRKGKSENKQVRVDQLTLKEIISLFKHPEIIKRLGSSQDLLAVATKTTLNDGSLVVNLCLFDKTKDSVEQSLVQYMAKTLDHALLEAFGDKDMIVLK